MRYLTLDTETTTIATLSTITNNEKKRTCISCSKPLIYNIGWVISDRDGAILKTREYVIAEIYYDSSVMSQAYYKNKTDFYNAAILTGAIQIATWAQAMDAFVEDAKGVDAVGAFNADFDFFRAIPYTENYIKKKYVGGQVYADWLDHENRHAQGIAKELISPRPPFAPLFDDSHFHFRGERYELYDIWGMACRHLINTRNYRNFCYENKMITNSGEFFKTSAEAVYRFMHKDAGFEESHTALSDAKLEAEILAEMTNHHSVTGVDIFPFRMLNTTDFHIMNMSAPPKERIETVTEAMQNYVNKAKPSTYRTKIANKIEKLNALK